MGKGPRITNVERIQFETLLNSGHSVKDCAFILGRSDKTLYRERRRGLYLHRNSDWTETWKYSSDLSIARYKEKCENCGRPLKIGHDHKLAAYLRDKIKVERYSPAAALASIDRENRHFETRICVRTVYNYIYSGMVFFDVDRNDLPQKPQKKKKGSEKTMKRISRGKSIEKRPEEVKDRKTFGHWEMDTVVSNQGNTESLLVLTERKTRVEIVWKIRTHEAQEPVRFFDKIEREIGSGTFRSIFKTITVDNGTENQDYLGLETSYRNKKPRTSVYYCHPYCSCERGSNENQNKLIRRFVPKGSDIGVLSRKDVQDLQKWINTYPRKLFGWKTAEELFREECAIEIGFVPAFFFAD